MKSAYAAGAAFRGESLPVRGAWIEIMMPPSERRRHQSLPVRGAWIEISAQGNIWTLAFVAPRKGSVD